MNGVNLTNSIDDDLLEKQLQELETKKLTLENLSKDINYIMSADEMIALKEISAKIARLKKSESIKKPITTISKIEDTSINKKNIKKEIVNELKKEKKAIIPAKADKKINSSSIISSSSKKEKQIQLLKNAKFQLSKWVSHIHLLTEHGILKKEKENIQENYTLCEFGKWYYGDGQNLLYFEEFKKLESIHKNMHKSYSNMYRIFSKKKKFSLFGGDNAEEKFNNAKKELVLIDNYSKEIISNINLLIEILYSLSEEEFIEVSKLR